VVIIGIAVWRKTTKTKSIQEAIHACCKKAAFLVQWYTLFTVGMLIFVVISTTEYFVAYYWIEEATKTTNLQRVWQASKDELQALNITTEDDFRQYLEIPIWIRIMNCLSQVLGLVTISIVVWQMWAQFILPVRRTAQKNVVWQNHEWHMPKRVNWILWILLVPTVFCIESMLANTKVWGLVTGKSRELEWLRFAEAQKLELLYAHEDLEVGSLIQFSAIYAFTRLISSFLEETALVTEGDEVQLRHVLGKVHGNNESDVKAELKTLAGEYKRLTRLGGFLGLWVYIIAGCIRAVVTIVLAIVLQIKVKEGVDDPAVKFLEDAELAFEGVTSTAFGLLTVLSVVTMIIMSGTYIVTDRIGNANKKFLGARVMLLTSEIAPKVVDAFEVGTPLFIQLSPILQYVPGLHMNREHAEMLKVAILNIACLVTVIMNVVFWKDVNIDEDDTNGLLEFPSSDKAAKILCDTEAPLLSDK
jgi:hypothetical protein